MNEGVQTRQFKPLAKGTGFFATESLAGLLGKALTQPPGGEELRLTRELLTNIGRVSRTAVVGVTAVQSGYVQRNPFHGQALGPASQSVNADVGTQHQQVASMHLYGASQQETNDLWGTSAGTSADAAPPALLPAPEKAPETPAASLRTARPSPARAAPAPPAAPTQPSEPKTEERSDRDLKIIRV